MTTYEDIDKLANAPKPSCVECSFLTPLGYCKLNKKHKNYILTCDVEEKRNEEKAQEAADEILKDKNLLEKEKG